MDNLSSLPTVVFPIIPSGFCPTGTTWAEILNEAFQTYGNQAIVDIPGLGQVTPAQIAVINATLVSLQNQINGFVAAQFRHDTVAVAQGDSSVNVTFSSDMPSSAYDILITILGDGTETSPPGWLLVGGSQVAGSMQLRFLNIKTGGTTFEYTVRAR